MLTQLFHHRTAALHCPNAGEPVRERTTSRKITRWILISIIALLLQGWFAPSVEASNSSSNISMLLDLVNLAKPGEFGQGETLHLIAVAYVNGTDATSGVIYITSNDPLKRQICNIAMSSRHFYCNISFPNTGEWTIRAQYRATTSGRGPYLASRSAKVNITGHPKFNNGISIKMTLIDNTFPGKFYAYDNLRITVQVFDGGKRVVAGDTDLTSNDPAQPSICGIIVGPGRGDYCNIDFGETGTWTITARYELVYNFPPKYVASNSLRVTIHR